MEWDVTRYADKLPRKAANSGTPTALENEDRMKRQYPLRNDSAAELPISRPCIIVDMHGIILAWYLPGVLQDSRQVSLFTLSDCCIKSDAFQSEIMAAAERLHPLLGKRKGGASWRVNSENFRPGTESLQGSVDISPAWFQLGHEVSCFSKILSFGSSFQ
jgi:hypothetical protein